MTLQYETPKFCEPQSVKFVRQLPDGITFAYDHCLGSLRDCWKGLVYEKNSKNVLHHAFRYCVP